jgi:arabinofuranosyltransferase
VLTKEKTTYLFFSLILISIVVFIIVLFRTAWVGDDAYITFRSVENFIHGYGPTFNIDERLQNFTHPLWFFLLSGLNAVTQRIGALNAWGQMYFVSVYLSMALSLSAVLIVVFGIARSLKGALLALIILTVSKVFVDYSTSGLENALSYFLLAVFLYIFLRAGPVSSWKLFWLALLAGLATFNRMDTLLIYLPALAWVIWSFNPRFKALLLALAGFVPFFLWEIFSVFYYGFPFPNTAYAKLNTGITRWALIRQGFHYYASSARLDPLILLALAGAIVWFLWKGSSKARLITVGVVLYLVYILWIGGDFMGGRFFAVPLLAMVALLATQQYSSRLIYAGLVSGVLLIGLFNPRSPIRSRLDYGIEGLASPLLNIDGHGVADERAFYYPRMGLMSQLTEKAIPGSNYSGRKWVYDPNDAIRIKLVGLLGVIGYQFGPNVHVVDRFALADPLMPRLRLVNTQNWRIGHFKHVIPAGYLVTLQTGANQIEDPGLAAYYDKLRLVTRGDLWDRQRWVEIFKLNTGQYDHLIEAFNNNY